MSSTLKSEKNKENEDFSVNVTNVILLISQFSGDFKQIVKVSSYQDELVIL